MLCTTSAIIDSRREELKSNFVLYINAEIDLKVLYVQYHFVKCCLVGFSVCSLVFV